MLSSAIKCGLFGILAAGVAGGPLAVRSNDVEISPIQERTSSIVLGTYNLATTHENEVLFNIGFGTTSANVGDAIQLEVECIDCRTWGTALLTTGGVSKDESIIGDMISFFENPIETIISAFDLDMMIEFEGVGGHFEFDILAADTVSYSFPIFESETPVGVACSEEVTVGLVLAIDLVFSLTAEIDLEAGFEFSFPEGAFITVDPLIGNIVDQGFTGGQMGHLPITCTSGSATFKAALRVRVQAGTTVEVFGTGFDFELGVYADLIEYVATIGTSDVCELYITENVDVNIGAFARAVVELDYKTFGASPAVVTTLLDYPLPSLCLTRPIDFTLSAIATATATPITSPYAAISGSYPSGSYLSGSYPTVSAAVSSTATGAVFLQGSSSYIASSTTPSVPSFSGSYSASGAGSSVSSSVQSAYWNSSISAAPSLTTSTVYTTDLITITSCAATVLHCPAESTSEIIVTSTSILYTTVCPVGQIQPTLTTVPSSSSTSYLPANTATIITSPIALTPCPTPIVSTIYVPTIVTPIYTMPTATSFPVPNPNWNSTISYTSQAVQTSVASGKGGSVATTSGSPTSFAGGNGGNVLATSVSTISHFSLSGNEGLASTVTLVPVPVSAAGGSSGSTSSGTVHSALISNEIQELASTVTVAPIPFSTAVGYKGSASFKAVSPIPTIASTVTVVSVYSPSSAPSIYIPASNNTILSTGSVKVQPTAPAVFTGGAAHHLGAVSGIIVALGASVLLL